MLASLLPLTVIVIFSGGISFSSTFLEFVSDFKIFLAILFPKNPHVASAVFWTTFLEVVFAASNYVFVAVSNNYFPYLLDRFFENDKNPYPLTYFLVLGSIE